MLKTRNTVENNSFNVNDLFEYFKSNEIEFDYTEVKDTVLNSVCSIYELKHNSISWVKTLTDEVIDKTSQYEDIVILCERQSEKPAKNIIYVDNVKRVYFRVLKHFFKNMDYDLKVPRIENSAVVMCENYGENLYVGQNSFIDKDVVIGNNVTILHNVVIQGNVKIGNDCIIESGTVIGACGFGYYKNEIGKPEKVPHLGGVVIGNNVTIGAGNCISRGSINDTIIEDNVKTDNLCHIAHSDHLKDGVMLAACAELSGSVTIGEDTWIAPGVTVINGAKIGKDVYTGIATNIVKDVPDGALIYGNPGKIKQP